METKAQIRVAQDSLVIQQLTIADRPTAAYISSHSPDQQVDALKNCIQLGARVCQFASDRMGATSICEKIEASADGARRLLTSITETTQKRIDDTVQGVFGKGGKDGTFQRTVNLQLDTLQRELEAKLDPDKATSVVRKIRDSIQRDVSGVVTELRKDLNLADPKSPFGLLRGEMDLRYKQLDEKLTQLVTQQAVKAAVGAERSRGTGKGVDFEDRVHMILDAISRPRHDQLERTGNDVGLVGKSKRGDFVVEINAVEASGTGLRVVIETKNDQTRLRELVRELDEAKENRAAQFGVAISTNPNLLPSGAPPICFPSPDKLVVHVADWDSDEGTFDPVYLEVAMDVARFVAIGLRQSELPAGMDLAAMDSYVGQAINVLTRFSEIKRRLTTIGNTAKETETLVDVIRDEVRASLETIREAIADQVSPREAATGEGNGVVLKLA